MSLTKKPFEKICVVGLGYIGLPTAGLLASRGFHVHGVDINLKAVECINKGVAHIVEPDLDILVRAGVNSGRLKAYTKPEAADVFIIAVPTPFKENHQPDVSFIDSAVESICPHLNENCLIILESTSPVGTTARIAEHISNSRPDLKNVAVAYCPERVLPGSILKELIENDRIIGGVNQAATEKAMAFYKSFISGAVLPTNSQTAELAKLSENAYRDVNIAFANELSLVCDKMQINVWDLIQLANHHPRVKILRPGPGVGGHCIAVDPWFIIAAAPEQTPLMTSARLVNDGRPRLTFEKIKPYFEVLINNKRPLVLMGLAYKPNIDDLRESPAVEIAELIAGAFKGQILIVEPYIQSLPPKFDQFPHVQLASQGTATKEAGLVAVLVMHQAFIGLESTLPAGTPIIDTVGILKL